MWFNWQMRRSRGPGDSRVQIHQSGRRCIAPACMSTSHRSVLLFPHRRGAALPLSRAGARFNLARPLSHLLDTSGPTKLRGWKIVHVPFAVARGVSWRRPQRWLGGCGSASLGNVQRTKTTSRGAWDSWLSFGSFVPIARLKRAFRGPLNAGLQARFSPPSHWRTG